MGTNHAAAAPRVATASLAAYQKLCPSSSPSIPHPCPKWCNERSRGRAMGPGSTTTRQHPLSHILRPRRETGEEKGGKYWGEGDVRGLTTRSPHIVLPSSAQSSFPPDREM